MPWIEKPVATCSFLTGVLWAAAGGSWSSMGGAAWGGAEPAPCCSGLPSNSEFVSVVMVNYTVMKTITE